MSKQGNIKGIYRTGGVGGWQLSQQIPREWDSERAISVLVESSSLEIEDAVLLVDQWVSEGVDLCWAIQTYLKER